MNILSDSFSTSYEDWGTCLFDAIKLLNLKLLRVLHLRQASKEKGSTNNGFCIAEGDVLCLLNSLLADDGNYSNTLPELTSIDARIEKMTGEITKKLSNTDNTINLPLVRLARMFRLTPPELDFILISLAPEINRDYEKIYAFFNDDLSKKAPSIALALDLSFGNTMDRIKGSHFFSPEAPLIYFKLLNIIESPEDSLLTRRFKLDERITRFILGDNGLPTNLSELARVDYPDELRPDYDVRNDKKDKMTVLLADVGEEKGYKPVFWLYGKARDEKRTTVRAICREDGLPLISIDLEDILYADDQRGIIKSLFREAALQSAPLFLLSGDLLYGSDAKSQYLKKVFFNALEEMSWVTFIDADALWVPNEISEECCWYPFEFTLPRFEVSKEKWASALKGSGITDSDIEAIAIRFNLSSSQIKNTVLYARRYFGIDKLTLDNLYKACSIRSTQQLSIYASRLIPRFTWDDIFLPGEKIRQLREISSHIKHKHLVLFKWGFNKKLALNGLNILFAGPSGTGKTMAAEIIAHDLKLNIFKVDLSMVVSKYIGETEKNLSRVFAEAETHNAILFFDEADALFGKRSEVKDAHDRYANLETGYLLQKMEEHKGVIIMASNLHKNMDAAFQRRMHFTVEFPFPDEEMRENIWYRVFPKEAPLDRAVDFEFLADKFKLTGGNIKNIALHAAFLAAADTGLISMEHIMQAINLEYHKMGCLAPFSTVAERHDNA